MVTGREGGMGKGHGAATLEPGVGSKQHRLFGDLEYREAQSSCALCPLLIAS